MTDLNSDLSRRAKVVSIDSAYMQARLPDVFVKVKECSQHSCMPLLQALFDHVDDALFEMADKADSNAAQNMYFESMREVRLRRRGMELCFLKSIEEAFYKVAETSQLNNDPAIADVSVAELSLVENDELEELMATSSLVSRAEKTYAQPLALLMARLNTLLVDQAINAENNPLGPAIICKAFIDACQVLETDINTKLVLFKLFDRYVVDGLEAVYCSCNKVLASAGVITEAPEKSKPEQPVSSATGHNEAEVFSTLQALLKAAPQPQSITGEGLQAAGQAPQIPHDSLMSLLQLVQQNLLSQSASGQAQVDVQHSLNSLCVERMPGQAMSIGQVDDDTINLVSMLFQFMLEDKNLAAPIKAQLARMQIPIVRVAMKDKSFFSRGGHPARKLLNTMATAALGWEEPKNIERDPLYKKISSIVNQLLEDFDSETLCFDEILSDFTAFVELERRRATLIEQRTLDAEDGKAKSEMARQAVKALLQEKLAGRDLPPVVMSLLQDAWSNVLFLANLKEGGDSLAWQQGVSVIDDLLWSVENKASSSDRKRLLQLIPNLLKSLRSGLTQVAFNPFEMNRMFDELENIHLNQLKQPATTEPSITESSMTEAVVDDAEVNIEPETPSQPAELGLKPLVLEEPAVEDTADDNVLLTNENRPEPIGAEQTLDEMLSSRSNGEDAGAAELESVGTADLDNNLMADLDNNLMAELDDMDDLDGFGEDQKLAPPQATSTQELDIQPAAQAADNEYSAQVDQLAVGNWLEMLQEDGAKLRCRLAAIIRGTGKYIFVNRAGMKVAEHSRESLAQAVHDEEIILLEDGLLFDRALESVIGNLREMKSQGAS